MDKNLQTLIHKYASEREIDYTPAQQIGEMYGKRFPDQETLIEWKQLIDIYLKSFETKDWTAIEEELGL